MAVVITRRSLLANTLASFTAPDNSRSYTFWVFGLLHPIRILLRPYGDARLHVCSGAQTEIVEGSRSFVIDASRTPLRVSGPHKNPVSFVLEIEGVIRRHYTGILALGVTKRLLQPIVRIDREVAVGSIIGAELPVQTTPLQALSAQALAARSFLCAEASPPRHHGAQFCDTTHCQFLRSPPSAHSAVAQAVQRTRGLVLSSESLVIPGHYSAACGGHTESAQLDHYQYRSVVCEPCRRAGIKRRGHGLGLCQTGAVSLARSGWDFQRIVSKYYPGCEIRNA